MTSSLAPAAEAATAAAVPGLIRQALDLPATFDLSGELTPLEIPGWDSVGWMAVINAIEEHYAFIFDFSELEDVYNINELMNAVQSKLASGA